MGIEELSDFVGEWEVAADLPGAEHLRGRVVFEAVGAILVQRTTMPVVEAPDSVTVVVTNSDATFTQHYFDSRGVARLYAMTFDGAVWTLQRSDPDFSALDFHQRYIGRFSDDRARIDGEWQTSPDGRDWSRDFRLTYQRAPLVPKAGRLTIGSTVLGVTDVARARDFYAAALDYVPRSQPDDTWVILVPREGAGAQLALSLSESPIDDHPRHHLDLYAQDQATEVERLIALGAQRVDDWDGYSDDSDFIVLEDTEGNRFCVIDAG